MSAHRWLLRTALFAGCTLIPIVACTSGTPWYVSLATNDGGSSVVVAPGDAATGAQDSGACTNSGGGTQAGRNPCGTRVPDGTKGVTCTGEITEPYECFGICGQETYSCFSRASCCADSCSAYGGGHNEVCPGDTGTLPDGETVPCDLGSPTENIMGGQTSCPYGTDNCGGICFPQGSCCPSTTSACQGQCARTSKGFCCTSKLPADSRCVADVECASRKCVGGFCRSATCAPLGSPCAKTTYASCCVGLCERGTCAPQTCADVGQRCDGDADCCTQACGPNKTCVGCHGPLGLCFSDAECCSGACDTEDHACKTSGVGGSCVASPGCYTGEDSPNATYACGTNSICCAAAPIGAFVGQSCKRDLDCCSMKCGSNGICTGSGPGEPCVADEGCEGWHDGLRVCVSGVCK